jgi:hypothetical protein
MTDDRRSPGATLLRIGFLCAVAVVILVAAQQSRWSSPQAKDTQTKPAEEPALAQATTAVVKNKDKLSVTIGLASPEARPLDGELQLTLLGPDGEVLLEDKRQVKQTELAASYRFDLKHPELPTEQLRIRCRFDKEQFEVPVSEVLVAKAHETSLTAGQDFHSGSIASLRCGVHGVKSLSETVPLPGADVEVQLKGPDQKVISLFKGKAGRDGVADAQFKMPAIPPGQYAMLVTTRSELGEEKLEHKINVKAESKILLVTDKPLYQPGQVMHIRALTLRPFDLTPVSGDELTFEVEDGKGNKVFKRSQKTSEYGIASVDFQLADEVNMGDYQVRALLGNNEARKTVAVKKYVLPKFKNEVTADKRYYLPKETIHADLQTDYFFGKPVAGGKVTVKASTFDVAFKDFQTWQGKTDDKGHTKFEIKLPDYFVGQPLAKGDAIVKLEIKVTDTADHSETITRTYPVSDQAIRVSLIPEGGRLVPGMENRVYAAALYPDGSPAKCLVRLWTGREAKGEPIAALQTNDAGLSEFKITPKDTQFRQGQWGQDAIEMLGGHVQQIGGPRFLLDLTAEAKDDKGNVARTVSEVNADPRGDNVILHVDRAIYKSGDTLKFDIRSSAGMATAYLDIVRSGQTMLTRWLDVKDGKASHQLDLPSNIFGTLEVHAYQILASGEIVRDSRVVYVHQRDDLKIDVHADKKEYLPGSEGTITFKVTDSYGKPIPAALGVVIVDEAVYALQEMQPGLEKVYFTLQEELLKPQAQIAYKPHDSIDGLVRDREVAAAKQQIAQALLATVKPKPPARWEVAPEIERRRNAEAQVQQIGFALYNYAYHNPNAVKYDEQAKRTTFAADLLKKVSQTGQLGDATALLDPFGSPLTLERLAKIENHFTADNLAKAITQARMQQLANWLVNYTGQNQAKFHKNNRWELPDTVLAEAVKHFNQPESILKDAWGSAIRLVKRDKKVDHPWGWTQLSEYELVSAGPDQKFGTGDDVKQMSVNEQHLVAWWWLGDNARSVQMRQQLGQGFGRHRFNFMRGRRMAEEQMPIFERAAAQDGAFAGAPGIGGGAVPTAPMAAAGALKKADAKGAPEAKPGDDKAGAGAGGAAPIRVREYFPETMLWQPALITDNQGVARMKLNYADSITTWRLSASASSRVGLLGGVSAPLRVFQDFFVDIDLPVSLTQNDEVAFPVAVYNYLKDGQTVKLELQAEDWFELIDSQGANRELTLKAGEVTAVTFRIKAKKIGQQPLTVKARGTAMSDAIKRSVEIVPDGQKVEQVFGDRLKDKITQQIIIPEHAVPDASKILVKLYPGVMSQILEGAEGMIRLPGG